MISLLFGILKKVWWIIPIAVLAGMLWWQKGVEARLRERVTLDESTISLYAGNIELQNQHAVALAAAGKAAERKAAQVTVVREKVAAQVVVRWKTRLVPVTVPTDCKGAISAGAVNAAQIGQLYMRAGK